jgi:thiol-disulfide isomerase/thioredoxin
MTVRWLLAAVLLLAGCRATSSAPSPTIGATATPMSSTAASPSVTPSSAPSEATGLSSDPLHAVTVTDVRTGASVNFGELAAEKPLLVEMMAIWCHNCRNQMNQVAAAHELADFHTISIDVEAYEVPADLAAYADQQGWDWTFAKADAALATALRDRFGTEILVPPGMPKLLLRPDGSVELLPIGQELSAADIAARVGGG